MSKKTPLQIVKEKFGSKEELVAKVAELLEAQEDESPEELKERLGRVANRKLLHLLSVGEKAKELGGREAISAKIAELKGLAKDKDYVESLKKASLAKLIDLQTSLSRQKSA